MADQFDSTDPFSVDQAQPEAQDNSIPAYMISANNHNIGNANQDAIQRPLGTRIYDMIGSAAVSGVNSFYNTALWAGNWFSDEGVQYSDAKDVIAGFDEDMAKYYDENRQTADLIGLGITSLVPGLGGVKVFQAGAKALSLAKGGWAAENLSKGLGILPGSRAAMIKEASETFAASRLPFSFKNPEVVKAITAGFGQNVLESAAFETAVAITQKKNPILTDLDFGQTLSNIVVGAGLGGAIGGVFSGVGTVYKIKAGIKALDAKLPGVTQIAKGAAGTRPSDELMLLRNDLDTTPINAPAGVDDTVYQTLYEKKQAKIRDTSTELFTKIAGGDADLGKTLYESVAVDPTSQYGAKILGLTKAGPISALDKLTKDIVTASNQIPKLNRSNTRFWYKEGDKFADTTRTAESTHWFDVPTKDVDPLIQYIPDKGTNEIAKPTHSVRYLKLWGSEAGKLSPEAPTALHLADKGAVSVGAKWVKAGDETFAIDISKPFDIRAASYDEALARNIWAMDSKVTPLGLKKGQTEVTISANDLPTLTKAYRESFTQIKVVDENGAVLFDKGNKNELLNFIAQRKDQLAQEEMVKAVSAGAKNPLTAEQVANKYDVRLGFLTGEQYSTHLEDSIFGLMKDQKDWYNRYHANSPKPPRLSDVKPWERPQNYGLVYDNSTLSSINPHEVAAMGVIRARQEIYQASANNAAADVLGDKFNLLPDYTEATMQGLNRLGAGPGMASYSNAAPGTFGQIAELTGSLITKWSREAGVAISNMFSVANYALANAPTEAAELFAILRSVRLAGPEKYVLDEANSRLILKKVRDAAEGEIPVIAPGVDEELAITSKSVLDWFRMNQKQTVVNVTARNKLNTAKGLPSDWDPEVVYAPTPNPDRFKHHAFAVDDNSLVTQGDTTMLYATTAEDLEKQMANARSHGFSVYTPNETAAYYKARGLYEHSLGLNESQMDHALRSSGASAPAFPLTGTPQEMLTDLTRWHSAQAANRIRDAVDTKYWREFGIVRRMGEDYDNVANAKIGFMERMKKDYTNPFKSYIDLALGNSLKGNHPTWDTINSFIDDVGTKTWNAISAVWKNPKASYGDLDKINDILQRYGVKLPATQAQMEAWVNHPAGQKVVSSFLRTQAAVLSTLVLRLDPVNAINNAVSSPILTFTELGSMIRNAYSGNSELAGQLAKLMDVGVPGTSDVIRSPTKLLATAYGDYFKMLNEARAVAAQAAKAKADGVPFTKPKTLLDKYKALNVIRDITDQFDLMMETATIKGTETAAELEAKRFKLVQLGHTLADFGERVTGNRLAEEMNRFVSARAMDLLTEPLVKNGIMTEATAGAYINTFVNRTQGNLIASQRPQMFQGAIGAAIGLFQSYQFNIMQQLLRYVGEGSAKDAMMLGGLQVSIFGLNGLPAFQAINQHIIGTASGNTNHVDVYSSINNAVGKKVGDWLTYGIASNILLDPNLKINLYSRGDINPRSVTVVPSQFKDIPVFSAYAKVFGAVKGMLQNTVQGGDVWNSLLGGIEQQGVSRPLAGIARVARGFANDGVSYSATGQGSLISANDLYSWANLARLSGAKPFEEAIAQDAVYRMQGYQAIDTERKKSLGEAIKSTLTAGKAPSDQQLQGFLRAYVKAGGRQEEFAQWYAQQLRSATIPQANKIIQNVKNPQSQYLQSIMGGRLMKTPADVLSEKAQSQAQ